MAFFILYKFHDTLIEMNLNNHVFSQKRKLIVLSFADQSGDILPSTHNNFNYKFFDNMSDSFLYKENISCILVF